MLIQISKDVTIVGFLHKIVDEHKILTKNGRQ